MSEHDVLERGDLIWIEISPQRGHEQGGHRPALVVTPRYYNEQSGLMLACPITTQIKGYPFEVILPKSSPIDGAILVDQLKRMDWHARKFKLAGRLSQQILDEVLSKLDVLIKAH